MSISAVLFGYRPTSQAPGRGYRVANIHCVQPLRLSKAESYGHGHPIPKSRYTGAKQLGQRTTVADWRLTCTEDMRPSRHPFSSVHSSLCPPQDFCSERFASVNSCILLNLWAFIHLILQSQSSDTHQIQKWDIYVFAQDSIQHSAQNILRLHVSAGHLQHLSFWLVAK